HSRACPENPASWDLAIYTGYTFEEILALPEDGGRQDAAPTLPCRSAVFALLGLASTLIDGRFVLAEKTLTLPFRGSRNQRILDLPASLAAAAPILQSDPRWHASAQK
ncbi:MAG: radical SAM protein, partial [Clostridiales Family XIII bacterium]|nr:radical SAM protein [Clostridiales Family XIII bacterium]